MEYHCTDITYRETGYFSQLAVDYLDHKKELAPFYAYTPDIAGIENAIKERGKYPVNRQVLTDTLQKQYASLNKSEAVVNNLAALTNENTYTICTAHQPNLLTGYLYFIYKIAHAISLADMLNKKHTDKHFVPVYFMGSEDNDLDELGVFRYGANKYRWDADGQKGAVGRMNTKSMKTVLDELFRVMGPPGAHTDELKELLQNAYLQHDTIGQATQYLVNELFGRYGLIVFDPDDADFKREIADVITDDLLNHTANGLVSKQAGALNELYHSQAYPRKINLFYLHDQLRERIERTGDQWQVLNTDIAWTQEELLQELKEHPERFSPNVILRGILQERLLPDVAFIGGGAEVAYWLQLKTVFEHYHTFYPTVLLRQSALWIEPKAVELQEQTNLSVAELFTDTETLIKGHVVTNTENDWQTGAEAAAFAGIMQQLKEKATALDPTLEASAEAALAKIKHQLTVLEKKMLRAEKRKHETATHRIAKLKEWLFPNESLQERTENFIEYYTLHGQEFIDTVVQCIKPIDNKFLIISITY